MTTDCIERMTSALDPELIAAVQDENLETESRIVLILHPNTKYIEFSLNDRKFNNERYTHSRKEEPKGLELLLIGVIENLVGVQKAEPGKSIMRVELFEGIRPRDVVPQIMVAIKEWANQKGYNPQLYVDDRRWEESPTHHEYHSEGGRKYPRGSANVGVSYLIWED